MKELSPHNGGGETQNHMEIENEETEISGESSTLQHNVRVGSGLNKSQSLRLLKTTCCSYLSCFLQLSKDEEEDMSPHMFNFREAVTQIGEREEKVVEQLRELRQVGVRGKPNLSCLLYVDRNLPCLSLVLLGRLWAVMQNAVSGVTFSSVLAFPSGFLLNWLHCGIPVLVASQSPSPPASKLCLHQLIPGCQSSALLWCAIFKATH